MPDVKAGGLIMPETEEALGLERSGLLVKTAAVIYDFLRFEAPIILSRTTVKNSTIGAYTYCSLGTTVCDAEIGRYCSIGELVYIGLGSHRTGAITTSPALGSSFFDWHSELRLSRETSSFSPVRVGHDVWIGTGSIVMGGLTVGNGAVIGAGSVVTKDVAPYTIVAGTPAKAIKQRFPDPVIDRLLQIQPWNYDLRAAYGMDQKVFGEVDEAYLDELSDGISAGRVPELPSSFFTLEPLDDRRWRLAKS